MVTCGDSIEEALFLMHNLVLACEAQIKSSSLGLENIQTLSPEAVEQVRAVVKSGQVHGKPDGVGAAEGAAHGEERLRKWKVWDLEFEAQMRMLDNAVSYTFLAFRLEVH